MDRYVAPGWFTRSVFNPFIAFLTRRGLSVAGSRVAHHRRPQDRPAPGERRQRAHRRRRPLPRAPRAAHRAGSATSGPPAPPRCGRAAGRAGHVRRSSPTPTSSRSCGPTSPSGAWEVGAFFDGLRKDSDDATVTERGARLPPVWGGPGRRPSTLLRSAHDRHRGRRGHLRRHARPRTSTGCSSSSPTTCVITQDDPAAVGRPPRRPRRRRRLAASPSPVRSPRRHPSRRCFEADGEVIQMGRTKGTTVETGTAFDIPEVHRWTDPRRQGGRRPLRHRHAGDAAGAGRRLRSTSTRRWPGPSSAPSTPTSATSPLAVAGGPGGQRGAAPRRRPDRPPAPPAVAGAELVANELPLAPGHRRPGPGADRRAGATGRPSTDPAYPSPVVGLPGDRRAQPPSSRHRPASADPPRVPRRPSTRRRPPTPRQRRPGHPAARPTRPGRSSIPPPSPTPSAPRPAGPLGRSSGTCRRGPHQPVPHGDLHPGNLVVGARRAPRRRHRLRRPLCRRPGHRPRRRLDAGPRCRGAPRPHTWRARAGPRPGPRSTSPTAPPNPAFAGMGRRTRRRAPEIEQVRGCRP